MYVIAYSPETNEVFYSRKLSDDKIMNERFFAEHVADMLGVKIDESEGYIPNCSGDIRVEFRRDPENSVLIYSGKSFYFKREDY